MAKKFPPLWDNKGILILISAVEMHRKFLFDNRQGTDSHVAASHQPGCLSSVPDFSSYQPACLLSTSGAANLQVSLFLGTHLAYKVPPQESDAPNLAPGHPAT